MGSQWAAMSDFGIETPEERRARYVRLARAATDAAAKSPLPNDPAPTVSRDEIAAQTGDSAPAHGGLNVKLNGMP
jgi:hypothetical protein